MLTELTALNTPLKDMLDAYCASGAMRGHMPGHKGSITVDGSHDITEIYCSDDLYDPQGPLLELERTLAKRAGSRQAFILTDGSSAGVRIICMCLSAAASEGTVLISRSVHRSVADGCVLAGLEPVFLPDCELADAVVPGVAAVFVTSPDYRGKTADLRLLRQRCDRAGALLAADEAHGAHLPYLGMPCASAYADICVQSMHKTMGALTQAAVLHVNSDALVPYARRFRRMLCTSSPSYLIMESMEAAAEYYPLHAAEFLDRVRSLRAALIARGITLYEPPGCDPARLCVLTKASGFDVADRLIRAGIVPEMADGESVVFILTPYDRDYAPLPDKLARCIAECSCGESLPEMPVPPAGGRALPMRAAALSPAELLPLSLAEGRISAVCAGLYPPGVPCIYPGELITRHHTEYLAACGSRASVFGLQDGLIAVTRL